MKKRDKKKNEVMIMSAENDLGEKREKKKIKQ